jgi:MFS family permease
MRRERRWREKVKDMNKEDRKTSIINRDFIMVVVGQIISLFGNAIIRFALPLYLLQVTGSAALFGTISAIALVPAVLMCPIGGILADRVNKRNIMVVLDFITAGLAAFCFATISRFDVVVVIMITMLILYGIQAAYQPSVTASIPLLVPEKDIMTGNAIINMVNSISGMLGPAIGGVIFAFAGVRPILFMAIFCFAASAIMEIFIKIPYQKSETNGNMITIAMSDMKQGIRFMIKDKPEVIKACLILAGINLGLSACIIIGTPVIVTEKLGFSAALGTRMYGYMGIADGAGGILGGILAGVFAKKAKIRTLPLLVFGCGVTLVPIILALTFPIDGMAAYWIIFVSVFIMMVEAMFASIQMISYLQILTPQNIMGKVISCATCICMCATPIGQVIYGAAFEYCSHSAYVILAAFVFNTIVAIASIGPFKQMENVMSEADAA